MQNNNKNTKTHDLVNFIEYKFNIENVTFSLIVDFIDTNNKVQTSKSGFLHLHHYFEMYYLSKGELDFEFEDENKSINSGDIFCIAPGVQHRSIPGPDLETYVLNFSFCKNNLKTNNNLYDEVKKLFDAEYIHLSFCDIVEKSFVPMVKMLYFDTNISIYKKAQHFYQIIETLLDITNFQSNALQNNITPDSTLSRLCIINRFINSCSSEKITLNDIADSVFLSPRQVDRIIKRHYGCTFHTLSTKRRMKVAAKMLMLTDKSISEISMHVGYDSVNTFYSAFKKYFNCLPTDYRKINTRDK